MSTVIEAFILIFTAELGDKSMLLAMTFATRFPLLPVLAGIFVGILANHGVAAFVGSQAGRLLPMSLIQPLSGVLFLIFAFTGLKVEEEHEEDRGVGKSISLAVALTFFIGEFGDKTQLATMTLASTKPALWVLLGTVTAMMCTSSLSIFLGSRIGKKIPEMQMRLLSCGIFLAFGLVKLKEAMPMTYWLALMVVALSLFAFLAGRFWRMQKNRETKLRETAETLKRQRELLTNATERMCLGQENCGACAGAACMVGYAKSLLKETDIQDVQLDISGLVRKQYSSEIVREGLAIILRYYEQYGWDMDPASLNNRLRRVFEMILYSKPIPLNTPQAYKSQLIRLDPSLLAWLDPKSNS